MPRVIVVGSGLFGAAAATELRRRGFEVTVFDPGPIPHPLAESTDISKIVRLDYGNDEIYTSLMEQALELWRSSSLSAYFHETGVLFLRRSKLEPGSFEADSYALLSRRGHRLEGLTRDAIRHRFPAWSPAAPPAAPEGATEDASPLYGYLNPEGGWVDSGNLVRHLVREAAGAGVEFAQGVTVAGVVEKGSRVTGVVTTTGDVSSSDFVVVAAGSWTPQLLPHAKDFFRPVGQPVFHLAPSDPSRFGEKLFPVFTADISRTGYYGFPVTRDGIVKIANHGVGRPMGPDSRGRQVTPEETTALRTFLRHWIGELAAAPIISTRVCVYCDTWDQHFWIAPDPERPGLVVAAGGSGHAFKFAPLVGGWIADALEGKVIERFRWRTAAGARGEEQARRSE
jgi:glycine/D-amino acid oxidase-like deaminating enzyme